MRVRGIARRLVTLAAILLMFANPAHAATYYYYRGGAPAASPTSNPPPSPAPAGTFAILVDGENFAVRGNMYSATTYTYGNAGQVAFSIQSGALPAGISINATTGTLSGTPATAGSSTFVVQGIDTANGSIATSSMTLDVVDPFSISGTPAATVLVGSDYSADFTLAGGDQPYGFSVGALPPGLSFTSGGLTGTLSGVPTAAGAYPITVTGTESHGMTVQYPYTLTVVTPLNISGTPPASGAVGTPYSGQMIVTGGSAPYSFSLAAGTLPTNVLLRSATGVIAGTPTTAGSKTGIRIKVTDSTGQTATSAPFSITIAPAGTQQPLSIAGSPSPTATETTGYSAQFSAGGGTTPYAYSLSAGTLPKGLTLNASSGLISGAPLNGSAGTYPDIAVKVTDATSQVATAPTFTLTVSKPSAPLAIAGTPPATSTVGTVYAAQFSAAGGSGTGYVFTSIGSALPPGLTLSPAGMLEGVPTTAGTYPNLRIRVADSAAHTAQTALFTITVAAPPPLLISGTPPTAVTQGSTYSATWTAFNGSGAGYHFTSIGGALPPGLSLADANGTQGILSGTATTSGTYSDIRIQVKDSADNVATSAAFTITVTPPPLTVTGAPQAQAIVGTTYTAQFSANGGVAPYTFSLASGTLPPGLDLNSSGLLTGTPTAQGSYPNIVIKVSDAASGSTLSAPFSIEVTDSNPLSLTWSPTTSWKVGEQFSATVTATGGGETLTFSHTGTLPDGVAQDPSTGALSGTVTAEGTFGPVIVTATDGTRTASTTPVTFSVVYPPVTVSGAPATSAAIGQAYSTQFTASGGTDTGFTYAMVGTLPSGLTLEPSTGIISGTPTVDGVFTGLAVKATDSASHSGTSATFSITVASAISISGTPAATTTVGNAYSAQFTTSGGAAPFVYSMIGTLPAGLALNSSTGLISGSATTAGAYTDLAVRVTDATSQSATSAAFSITVRPALTVSGTPQTSVVYGTEPYSSTFTASGGTGTSYVWSTVGTLPPGVTMNASTGVLSASSISVVGAYPGIRAKVTDSDGTTALSLPFSITITGEFQLVANPQPQVVVGADYSSNFSMTGGKAPYTIAATELPAGLNFSTTETSGSINGAPTETGDYEITVTSTDALNTVKTHTFTLHVVSALAVEAMADMTITEGDTFSAQLMPIGGAAPYTYSSAGALPSGISFDTSTGTYSGRAATGSAGGYSGLVGTITDNLGYQAQTPPFTVTVFSQFLLTGTPPMSVQAGEPYVANFLMSGGQGPYVISATGLPSGLSLTNTQPTAAVTGSTADAGAHPIIITATDARGSSQSISYTLNVTPVAQGDLTVVGNPPATVVLFRSYSTQFVAQGGTGTGYVYSITGTLPGGISIDPNTGILQGQPWETGVFENLQVSATDSAGATAVSQIFQIEVVEDPSPLYLDIFTPNVGYETEPYAAQVVAGGGNGGPYTYEMLPGFELPGGLWLDSSTGAISGVIETGQGGWFNVQFLAYDSVGNFMTDGRLIQIVGQVSIAADDISVQEGNDVANAYQNIVAGGGDGNLTYALNGTVPPNVTIDPTGGYLVGTPPVGSAGNYQHLTITATDGNGHSKTSAEFTLHVTAKPLPPPVQVGAPLDPQYYTLQFMGIGLNANGGDGGPYTFEVIGTLPPGLSFNGTRNISGTPQLSALGEWPITLKATDGSGSSGTQNIVIKIVNIALAVGGSGPTTVNAGASYSGRWFASWGSRTGYVYNMIGTLPPGLSLSPSTGYITGTVDPGASGFYGNLQVGVTDSVGATGVSEVFGILVHGQTPVPLAIYGTPSTTTSSCCGFQAQFYADGGTGTGYTFTATGDTGMSFDMSQAGKLWVYSASAGTHTYTVTVTDSSGSNTSAEFSFTAIANLTVTVPTLITGSVDQPLTPDVFAIGSGGTGSYTYSYPSAYPSPAALPSGLSINPSTGKFEGIPTKTGDDTMFRVQVTDSSGQTALSNYFEIHIMGPLKLTGVPDPDAYMSEFYQSTTPTTSGGSESAYYENRYVIVQGTLPPGLSLDSRGFIQGTPTAIGTYSGIQIQVTDTGNNTALSDVFSITVHPPRGAPDPVYAWFDVAGSNPSLPQQPSSALYPTLNVGVNTTIEVQATAVGGLAGPYTYSITPGYSLPPGGYVDPQTGLLSVAFETPGLYRFSVRATDRDSGLKADTGVLMVNVTNLAISGHDADIFMSSSVSIATVTSGGQAPFTYKKGGGRLPANISIDANTGWVSGTAGLGTIPGAYTFSVFVTDANGKTADTGPITITISDQNGCMLGAVGPYGIIGYGWAGPGFQTRGTPTMPQHPYVWAADPWFDITITGPDLSMSSIDDRDPDIFDPYYGPDTPGVYGPYSAKTENVTFVDYINPDTGYLWYFREECGHLGPYNIEWVYELELDDPGLLDIQSGQPFAMSLSARGGKLYGGIWYTATPLPAGLTIDNHTGVISGNVAPAAKGFYAITVSAMDAYGISRRQAMYMNVR